MLLTSMKNPATPTNRWMSSNGVLSAVWLNLRFSQNIFQLRPIIYNWTWWWFIPRKFFISCQTGVDDDMARQWDTWSLILKMVEISESACFSALLYLLSFANCTHFEHPFCLQQGLTQKILLDQEGVTDEAF